jgi:hypothetical protein
LIISAEIFFIHATNRAQLWNTSPPSRADPA